MKTKMRTLLFVILMTCFALPSSAADFEVDGFGYIIASLDDMTCGIAYYNKAAYIPEDFTIPETVTYRDRTFKIIKVHDGAFKGAPIKTLTIPETITDYGRDTFADCKELTSVSFLGKAKASSILCFSGCEKLTSITIPAEISKIYSFSDCKSLESVTFLGNYIHIGSDAFKNCISLKRFTFPAKSRVSDESFTGCVNLKSLFFLETYVGPDAFSDCRHIDSIFVKQITEWLKPRSIPIAPFMSLGSLSALRHIYGSWDKSIPNSIYNPNRLEVLVLPSDYIDDYDDYSDNFNYLSAYGNLKKLIIQTNEPPKYSSLSIGQYLNLEVIVPTEALSNYQNDPVWGKCWNLKGGAENITGIRNTVVDEYKKSNTGIYNLNGHKVENPTPGKVYISDGKKFIAH